MRVALAQSRPVAGKAEGLVRLVEAAREAAATGAEIVILPEMALTGYDIGAAAVRAAAETLDGPSVAAIAEVARDTGIAIVAGLPEAEGGKVYNTAVMVGADGSLLASCRKTHLFGEVDRAQFSPGAAISPVFDYLGWRLALAICYDVEFPELVRALALAGAEALLVPTANMHPFTGVARRLVPARAEENEIFIAYANYVGREGRFDYCGLSCVVGPDGEDLARAGEGEEMINADLDHARLADWRRLQSHLDDRRFDLYRPLCEGAKA